MSSRASARSTRSTSKASAETRMVRQREKEHDHQVKWGSQVRYYKSFEKANNKFEEWTSPRYYQTSNQMIEERKNDQERKEKLEARRGRLKKLFEEEARTHDIEMMVKNRYKYERRGGNDVVPTEVLREVHLGLKLEEEQRRRHEAELALYHHWRNNNPIVRDHERIRSVKNIKLSWLDQQVEKRLEKEKAEEECKRVLAERNRRLEEERALEIRLKQETEAKNEKLRFELDQQVEELKSKQKQSEELRLKENEETQKLVELQDLEERLQTEVKRKLQRELALENLKQHKMKLKQKALDVQENLAQECEIIRKLQNLSVADKIEDQQKKLELKRAMGEFLKFSRDQQDLEKQRQKHFDFVFDSEAKQVYERQRQIWLDEQRARETLLKDVLDAIKNQVDEKIKLNQEKQKEVLNERQSALKLVEEYDQDIRKNEEEVRRKKFEWKQGIKEQIKEKEARVLQEKMMQEKELDLEFEKARKEEERLRREIVDLQRRQAPIRHVRSRIFY